MCITLICLNFFILCDECIQSDKWPYKHISTSPPTTLMTTQWVVSSLKHLQNQWGHIWFSTQKLLSQWSSVLYLNSTRVVQPVPVIPCWICNIWSREQTWHFIWYIWHNHYFCQTFKALMIRDPYWTIKLKLMYNDKTIYCEMKILDPDWITPGH